LEGVLKTFRRLVRVRVNNITSVLAEEGLPGQAFHINISKGMHILVDDGFWQIVLSFSGGELFRALGDYFSAIFVDEVN